MSRATTMTALFLLLHILEDVSLISIAIWTPLPWWIRYALGIGVSAVLFNWLVRRLVRGG